MAGSLLKFLKQVYLLLWKNFRLRRRQIVSFLSYSYNCMSLYICAFFFVYTQSKFLVIQLFSNLVELYSENVCLCVSLCPKTLGQPQEAKTDLSEIWLHLFLGCSLGKYLGVFFSFVKNFIVIGPSNCLNITEVDSSAVARSK